MAVSAKFEFASINLLDTSSTGVWNLVTKQLHLPFVIDRTDTSVGSIETEDDSLPIGTGKDGQFTTSTYASFDINQGASTTLTLDTSRTYEFTEFTLETLYTLKGSGTAPLRIRIQGDATIKGAIDLRGSAGGDATSDTSSSPTGGISCCGGARGGDGGSGTTSALNGTSADSQNMGKGISGTTSSAATKRSGGGGGGGFEAAPFAAASGKSEVGGGAGGAAGSGYSDEFLTTLLGGSGGGGGAHYILGGAGSSSGAAGGGGGGALQLTLGGNFRVETGGSIFSGGGAGGQSASPLLGGPGGGGAGGAIFIAAGGSFVNNGTINASRGVGGNNSGPDTEGNGAQGRTRFVSKDVVWTGTGVESPLPNMPGSVSNSFGQTFYSKNPHTVLSQSYDTKNSSPTYTSIETDETKPSGTTLTYEFAGSSDNFQSDSTGFVASESISQLNTKRYFKFRVTLQSTNRAITPVVRSLTVNYDERRQEEFHFGGGCASVHLLHESSSPQPFLWFTLLLFLGSTLAGGFFRNR